MIKILQLQDSSDAVIQVEQIIDKHLMDKIPGEALSKAVDEIVKAVVDEIVKQKLGEVLSKIDTQAIANLSIARCANRIADELNKTGKEPK